MPRTRSRYPREFRRQMVELVEEIRRLRRENRQLRLEREILAKAAAWFAQEAGSVPPRSTSS